MEASWTKGPWPRLKENKRQVSEQGSVWCQEALGEGRWSQEKPGRGLCWVQQGAGRGRGWERSWAPALDRGQGSDSGKTYKLCPGVSAVLLAAGSWWRILNRRKGEQPGLCLCELGLLSPWLRLKLCPEKSSEGLRVSRRDCFPQSPICPLKDFSNGAKIKKESNQPHRNPENFLKSRGQFRWIGGHAKWSVGWWKCRDQVTFGVPEPEVTYPLKFMCCIPKSILELE